MGLAAYESGWLDSHNRALNDPFGATHHGGPNVAYDSIADAVAYWEKKYGPVVRGASQPARTSLSGYGVRGITSKRNLGGKES